MSVKKGQEYDVCIEDLVFGGRGLVRLDGLAVFVDQAAPGDEAKIRIYKKRRNYAEARVVELLRPSEYRVRPPCPYSGFCGGCKWQFLKYDQQLEHKRRHVAESLVHIAGIEDVPVHATIPSERIFGYRNKMEFTCSDRRWLLPSEMSQKGIENGFALGLHVPGTFYKVLDTRACLLQPSIGNGIMAVVRNYIRESERPVYGLRSHVGFWRFLMLRHSHAADNWMVNIITAADEPVEIKPLAEQLLKRFPSVVSVVNNITARKAGVAVGEFERVIAGENSIQDRIGDYQFEISANSFFQTNTIAAARLYDVVRNYAGLSGRESVLDLYSGTGTIAIYLSDRAAEVTGFEIVDSAVEDARNNCRINGISNCRFIHGDIQDGLGQVQNQPDVMIIDPPRAGMHKNVVKQVVELAPRKIVYVSCNPSTLARDAQMLQDLYSIREVQPVDMFPHTYHIESVARLERKP